LFINLKITPNYFKKRQLCIIAEKTHFGPEARHRAREKLKPALAQTAMTLPALRLVAQAKNVARGRTLRV
jgi:hypothetical protein